VSSGAVSVARSFSHLGVNVWSRRITQQQQLVSLVRDEWLDFLRGRLPTTMAAIELV